MTTAIAPAAEHVLELSLGNAVELIRLGRFDEAVHALTVCTAVAQMMDERERETL